MDLGQVAHEEEEHGGSIRDGFILPRRDLDGACVSLATADFFVMSVLCGHRLLQPLDELDVLGDVALGVANRSRISSSSSPILILKPVCCLTKTTCVREVGALLAQHEDVQLISSPACVTVKLINVVSA